MSAKAHRQLDAEVGRIVLGVAPRRFAWAANADESGGALFEGASITREQVRAFCVRFPRYHYCELEVFPEYSRDPGLAMGLLARCMAGLDGAIGRTDVDIALTYDEGSEEPWIVVTNSVHEEDIDFHVAHCCSGPSLEVAVCRFAVRLFSGRASAPEVRRNWRCADCGWRGVGLVSREALAGHRHYNDMKGRVCCVVPRVVVVEGGGIAA